ncbi:MAG: hypothetical protein QNJ94_18520 [Alphaproteobacteria bacterium]|nr:hypothetical protein [Alphaproteobacteria bacterium]
MSEIELNTPETAPPEEAPVDNKQADAASVPEELSHQEPRESVDDSEDHLPPEPPMPPGHRKAEPGEISRYRAAIRALDEFANALGGINASRHDPELAVLLNGWHSSRQAVIARFERIGGPY